jgi:hypothetical protein
MTGIVRDGKCLQWVKVSPPDHTPLTSEIGGRPVEIGREVRIWG